MSQYLSEICASFDTIYTVADLAREFKVSEDMVLRWWNSGKGDLVAINIGNGSERKTLRFTETAVQNFIKTRRVLPQKPVLSTAPNKTKIPLQSSGGLMARRAAKRAANNQ